MKKENTKFDFIKNEHNILNLWEKGKVFDKMVEKNARSKERFRFMDGPITANGSMCMHHVWGRTLKDAFIKYNTLQGRSCQYQNGFDAQGMWVEVEVEKLLGLNDKKAIMDYGLDKFTEKCMERVRFFSEMQTKQSIRLGQTMDWDNSYYTNTDMNITGIWHFLKVCHEKNLLVRSYKAMPWCPRCGTSLSEHEMSGSYREHTHKAVFVKLPLTGGTVIDGYKKGLKMLVWTTTPWTLCANVAVAINPEHKYAVVEVKSDDSYMVVGKEALKVLKDDMVRVVEEIDGSKLLGAVYTPPLKMNLQNFEHTIVPWEEVSAKEGTGAVHIAPGCGAEDYELGKVLGLKQIIPIDDAGVFTSEFEYLAGLSTVDCEPVVFEKLKENGTLYYTHNYTHNYPYCWRCKTNVVFKLVSGWDIATTPMKPALLESVETVNWSPDFMKKSMQNWLENMGDWNISRRRFYGLPLPFYPCDCGHLQVVGSLEELVSLSSKAKVDALPHLHRPYIDNIKITCPKCGKKVSRVPDVGDCWLDAGIAPFSTKQYQDGYHAATGSKYWRENFPSDLVLEMKEQIRLWFYSMLFMSVVLTGKAPFKNAVGYSTMLDEDGKKFSKTGPKNISLDDAAETIGADVMRYVFASANPSSDMRFGITMSDEARKKLIAFWNSYVFFNTYAVVDNPDIMGHTLKNLEVTDIWLLETLNKYIEDCKAGYDDFKAHNVVVATEKFVDDLSNFYIRTNRRRFWKSENNENKLNAYYLLYHAIKAVTVVMSPITPFVSEYIWQGMVKEVDKSASEFVLTSDFPKKLNYDGKVVSDIIGKVDFVKNILSLGLRLRAAQQLKIKQPLRTMFIIAKAENNGALALFRELVADELNIKHVEIVADESKFNIPYLLVNFKTAGAVLKGEVQKLKTALEALSEAEMAKAVAQFDKGSVTVGDFKNLASALFERKLKSKTEFVSETEGDITVVLDTTLDEQLVQEGQLREIIRGIQVARQEADLDITARIALGLKAESAELKKLISDNSKKIMEETLAVSLTESFDKAKYKSSAEIDGEKVAITFSIAIN